MKKNLKIILLGISFAFVLFFGLLAVQAYMLNSYEQTKTVIAKVEVPAGTQITKENANEYFEEKEVRKAFVLPSSVTEIKDLYNSYARHSFSEGELAYDHSFCSDENVYEMFDDPVEASISLTSFADGVSGTLRKGDYVFVYFVDKEYGTVECFGSEALYIKEAFSSAGVVAPISDKETAASVFTVVMDKTKSKDFCTQLKTKDVALVKTDGMNQIVDEENDIALEMEAKDAE